MDDDFLSLLLFLSLGQCAQSAIDEITSYSGDLARKTCQANPRSNYHLYIKLQASRLLLEPYAQVEVERHVGEGSSLRVYG